MVQQDGFAGQFGTMVLQADSAGQFGKTVWQDS